MINKKTWCMYFVTLNLVVKSLIQKLSLKTDFTPISVDGTNRVSNRYSKFTLICILRKLEKVHCISIMI